MLASIFYPETRCQTSFSRHFPPNWNCRPNQPLERSETSDRESRFLTAVPAGIRNFILMQELRFPGARFGGTRRVHRTTPAVLFRHRLRQPRSGQLEEFGLALKLDSELRNQYIEAIQYPRKRVAGHGSCRTLGTANGWVRCRFQFTSPAECNRTRPRFSIPRWTLDIPQVRCLGGLTAPARPLSVDTPVLTAKWEKSRITHRADAQREKAAFTRLPLLKWLLVGIITACSEAKEREVRHGNRTSGTRSLGGLDLACDRD